MRIAKNSDDYVNAIDLEGEPFLDRSAGSRYAEAAVAQRVLDARRYLWNLIEPWDDADVAVIAGGNFLRRLTGDRKTCWNHAELRTYCFEPASGDNEDDVKMIRISEEERHAMGGEPLGEDCSGDQPDDGEPHNDDDGYMLGVDDILEDHGTVDDDEMPNGNGTLTSGNNDSPPDRGRENPGNTPDPSNSSPDANGGNSGPQGGGSGDGRGSALPTPDTTPSAPRIAPNIDGVRSTIVLRNPTLWHTRARQIQRWMHAHPDSDWPPDDVKKQAQKVQPPGSTDDRQGEAAWPRVWNNNIISRDAFVMQWRLEFSGV
ncbi:hypothetical protein JX266_009305 [Neoarthrinium moseri]|nr:hypothetical protein JX266_009305 [Neoarthrinium moseri]